MTLDLDPALRTTLRGAFALLWLAAASHKLRAPARFRDALAGYQLVPATAVRVVAALVAALELALALALLAPGTGAAPALATGALLALYSAAISINLRRGRRTIDCGCGARPQPLGERLVVRNAVLIAIALAAALPAHERSFVWLDAATVIGGTAALAALYSATDTAIGNSVRALRTHA